MTDEKKIEILYDHYKDTFENQKVYLQKRNYYTLICLGLIASISFQISNPDQSSVISNELIKKNIADIKIDLSYINNVLMFTLLWVVIMYYQINLLIEKIYIYIQDIEGKLTEEMKPFEISREGKNYLDHYPWFSEVVHKIYSVGFPLSLICVSIIKWTTEKKQIVEPLKNGHFWFDTIVVFSIVLTSLLYLSSRHFDFSKKKKCTNTNHR
jgi:hypothetical protein